VAVEHVQVAVVGGGQAGLAVSQELGGLGIEHVLLERGRVAQTWRDRWDSFCLVTPNWATQLPGYAYDGADPDGYMQRDEIVAYLERYAADAPVREGVDVRSIDAMDGGFALSTSSGDLGAETVVIATGAYQRPHRPEAAATLPASLHQIDVEDYRSEQALPPGPLLVVGSGQSGCQIAEELHEAGREGRLGLWESALDSETHGRPRLALVGARDGLPGPFGRVTAGPGCPARREHPHDRPRRWTRPPLADA
jgi:putative flavoprotein involved in K+ transport